MQNEFFSDYDVVKGIAPITGTDDTALVSAILDTSLYSEVLVTLATGVLADANATFTTLFEDGDDSSLSDHAEVTGNDIVGSASNFTYASDGVVDQWAYKGAKRYLRVTVTPSGNTGNAPISVMFIGKKKKVGSTL